MKATIKDIAERAQVSTATVSRVLAKKPYSYRPETAAKIRAIAKKLGYQKNMAAAELAANNSNLLAVIIDDLISSNKLIAAIQAACDQAGHQMIILYAGHHDSRLLTQAISVAIERHAVGILLLATALDKQAAHTLRQANIPCRLISTYDPKSPIYTDFKFTSSDHRLAGRIATNCLITHGYQRIGLIGIGHSSTGRQYLKGYQESLLEHNITPKAEWVCYRDHSQKLLTASLKYLQNNDADAIITADDMDAIEIINIANSHGINIPHELGIISLNGTSQCDMVIPTITSVTQNFYQIGSTAVKSLLNNSDSQFIPVKLKLGASIK